MYILGIWDGHDCGTALIETNEKNIEIKAAANEERFTKRKLEVGFPEKSIDFCLKSANTKPSEIQQIAITTTDFAKTLTRLFPSAKESYYRFRRKKIEKPRLVDLRRNFKYRVTEIKEKPLCRSLSKWYFKKNLEKMGFKDFKLYIVEHHLAHATGAAYCSGFDKALVITIDGVGDGLSGTVNVFNNGEIERLSEILAKDSIGIFFEQVTNLLGMRELEDEGKVMALSNYAYGVSDEKNKLLNLFEVDGLRIKSNMNTASRYKFLKRILWNTPREEFSFMAQRTLEKKVVKLFENAIKETGIGDVCWSGGVASNIKANMLIKNLPSLKRWFVFPHMGDGGLALGAALELSYQLNGYKKVDFNHVFFGPNYSEEAILEALKKEENNLKFERIEDIAGHAADVIAKDNYILWYQDKMEYGPRALGNRSILAPAHSLKAKNELNMKIKQRNWFQPFCPSLLEEEAEKFFVDIKGFDKYMTMGYSTKPEATDRIRAVINVDNSSRPQMLGKENLLYRKLMENVKKITGDGIVLNTSFNLHGFPIVNTPEDAIEVMLKNKAPYLIMDKFFVEFK